VASVRDRQRAAARARLERELAARQEAARRKRQLRLRIAGGAGGVVVLVLLVWVIVAVSGGGKSPAAAPSASAAACTFTPLINPTVSPQPKLPPQIRAVGAPDPEDAVRSGFRVMTINTNLGVIKIAMDLAKAPCIAASMTNLADKNFFANTSCPRLTPTSTTLLCGDPSKTGGGGPDYSVADENLPLDKLPVYHEGDVAMFNTGQANINGSQFYFVYKNIEDPTALAPKYSLWGHVIQGLDIILKVAKGGSDEAFANQGGGGHPRVKLTFISVSVGPVVATEPTASPLPVTATSAPPTTAAPPTSAPASPAASG
jgi:peptidyl-prolyl cis-trans isomerase B (cyclophilin B)